ncbi:tyrosine-type recombinase/integrase [Vibrio parahaemolyticus]|uniref:tyrosine-type recombinase/integrase n=1 Tax=Vibrio parahaemolyticus TaxID=670 RepID=UPI00084AA95B|nr:tyrosine-type recombinase/integrase [Vibrio parahaemolyticus]EHH1094051.1 tyrosine-type recombinase/integrase [Vibrio parahaemolyticus]MBE3892218.1 tyrosine-type recombinase/integrase [Vibrio parahaemolyticus]MBE3940520.1 tyrosine-type recombinase/integrase [Vibrio parahaemolyticus]MBE3990957.1 tyrosine-type recombinase/integrase [Vibrio parahaemolyticus]MBE4244708.1 tyrosine-type recombinase/integrase [Vibrio parahaemolyticus]
MKKHNTSNVRAIRNYCEFLREAKRLSDVSVDGVTKAINRFEVYTKYKDFKQFHRQQAVGFKKYLVEQKNVVTDTPLSKATVHTTLRHLKTFFQWLALQDGYRSRINYSDTEYFNLSEKDARIANAKRKKPVPKIEQVTKVLEAMPSITSVEMRDRALVAFTLLTGARDSAIASLKIKHVDVAEQSLYQDAREVKTKFSKTFTTYFFPVGELPQQIFTEWVSYLTHELSFGPDDPLFPRTKVKNNPSRKFESMGLTREHWTTAGPIRRIFKQAFKLAELPYYNPHSFRNTLVRLGEQLCSNAEEFKAWSQNLGHEGVLTTFYSYGDVADYRQAELLKKLAKPKPETNDSDAALLQRMLAAAREQGI